MGRHWRYWLTLALSGLLLAAPMARPQGNVAPPAEPNTAKAAKTEPAASGEGAAEDDQVKIEFAQTLQSDSETGPHHLRGNVRIVTRGVRLLCDAADYDENTSSLVASGNLKIIDKEAVITGDLLTADLDRELMTVTGNVQVVAQKKPESQQVKDGEAVALSVSRDKAPPKAAAIAPDGRNTPQPTAEGNDPDKAPGKGKPLPAGEARYRRTVITCERVEYYYADDEKRMVATPRVKAVQEERTVYADEAVFQDLERLITLTGDVRIQSKNGDEMQCTKAVVHVDEEWVKAEGVSAATLHKRKAAADEPSPSPTGSTPDTGE